MYQPRRAEDGLLHRVVRDHWRTFAQAREAEGRYLPRHVTREFESFLQCGVLANGFVRLKCDSCRHEKLVGFSCKRRGFCPSCGARRMSESAAFLSDWIFPRVPVRQWVLSFPMLMRFWMARDPALMTAILAILIRALTGYQRRRAKRLGFKTGESGSVTLVQRFGGSANLNIHFHTVMIEGVYRLHEGRAIFQPLPPPSTQEVEELLRTIQKRVIRHLRKRGLLPEDEHSEMPAQDIDADPSLLDLCQGASVQNRVALGESAGQRVKRVGSFGLGGEPVLKDGTRCVSLGGFSLHANTSVEADEREDLEKLCRYVARPPISEGRLELTRGGDLLYHFKQEWSDGTRAVKFTPLEFVEKLVALIPQPRIHLTRFHGVLAPHSKLRPFVVPPAPDLEQITNSESEAEPPSRDPRRLRWAELLKRVFQLDLTTCPDCGGTVRFVAAVMERGAVRAILEHLGLPTTPVTFHPPRGPPQRRLESDPNQDQDQNQDWYATE